MYGNSSVPLVVLFVLTQDMMGELRCEMSDLTLKGGFLCDMVILDGKSDDKHSY